MKKILYVEDSVFFANEVMNKFKSNTDFEIIWTKSMAETVELLKHENKDNFFAGILDFELPDAPYGEIIDTVIAKGIPAIIFTGYVDKEVRDIVWSKYVIDYVLKEDYQSIEYIFSLLKQLDQNHEHKIIIADTSMSFCSIVSDLLKIRRYKSFIAKNSDEVLKLLEENPDTRILITEYNLPETDGLTLIHKIREKHTKDTLAIIGISAEDKKLMAPRFLKYGANDYISKQFFTTEEFYSRITQNIEYLEHLKIIKESSIKDYLTDIFNRKYFFEFGQKLLANVERGNISAVCVMIDIDNFSQINEKYSNNAGDIVIQKIATLLKERIRKSDIIARFGGGEDFCVMAVNMRKDFAKTIFEDFCEKVRNTEIEVVPGKFVIVTISIGICTNHKNNIQEFVDEAHRLLIKAKRNGGNRVEIDI